MISRCESSHLHNSEDLNDVSKDCNGCGNFLKSRVVQNPLEQICINVNDKKCEIVEVGSSWSRNIQRDESLKDKKQRNCRNKSRGVKRKIDQKRERVDVNPRRSSIGRIASGGDGRRTGEFRYNLRSPKSRKL